MSGIDELVSFLRGPIRVPNNSTLPSANKLNGVEYFTGGAAVTAEITFLIQTFTATLDVMQSAHKKELESLAFKFNTQIDNLTSQFNGQMKEVHELLHKKGEEIRVLQNRSMDNNQLPRPPPVSTDSGRNSPSEISAGSSRSSKQSRPRGRGRGNTSSEESSSSRSTANVPQNIKMPKISPYPSTKFYKNIYAFKTYCNPSRKSPNPFNKKCANQFNKSLQHSYQHSYQGTSIKYKHSDPGTAEGQSQKITTVGVSAVNSRSKKPPHFGEADSNPNRRPWRRAPCRGYVPLGKPDSNSRTYRAGEKAFLIGHPHTYGFGGLVTIADRLGRDTYLVTKQGMDMGFLCHETVLRPYYP